MIEIRTKAKSANALDMDTDRNVWLTHTAHPWQYVKCAISEKRSHKH